MLTSESYQMDMSWFICFEVNQAVESEQRLTYIIDSFFRGVENMIKIKNHVRFKGGFEASLKDGLYGGELAEFIAEKL